MPHVPPSVFFSTVLICSTLFLSPLARNVPRSRSCLFCLQERPRGRAFCSPGPHRVPSTQRPATAAGTPHTLSVHKEEWTQPCLPRPSAYHLRFIPSWHVGAGSAIHVTPGQTQGKHPGFRGRHWVVEVSTESKADTDAPGSLRWAPEVGRVGPVEHAGHRGKETSTLRTAAITPRGPPPSTCNCPLETWTQVPLKLAPGLHTVSQYTRGTNPDEAFAPLHFSVNQILKWAETKRQVRKSVSHRAPGTLSKTAGPATC